MNEQIGLVLLVIVASVAIAYIVIYVFVKLIDLIAVLIKRLLVSSFFVGILTLGFSIFAESKKSIAMIVVNTTAALTKLGLSTVGF